MEPIPVSLEVGKAALERETRLWAQGADPYHDSPALRLQAKALSGLAGFTLRGNSVGGCFAGKLATQGEQFSLSTALLFQEKQTFT